MYSRGKILFLSVKPKPQKSHAKINDFSDTLLPIGHTTMCWGYMYIVKFFNEPLLGVNFPVHTSSKPAIFLCSTRPPLFWNVFMRYGRNQRPSTIGVVNT